MAAPGTVVGVLHRVHGAATVGGRAVIPLSAVNEQPCVSCRTSNLTCMGGFPCNHCLCKNRGCTKALINNPNEAPRTGHFALPPECVPSFMSAVARAVDSQAIMEAVGELAMARTRQGLIHRTRMVAHLRAWCKHSNIMGQDMTYGLYDRMRGVIHHTLEETYIAPFLDANVRTIPGETQEKREQRRRLLHVRRQLAVSETFRESQLFKSKDDNYTSTYVCLYDTQGMLYFAANRVFERRFAPSDQLLVMAAERGLLLDFAPMMLMPETEHRSFRETLFDASFRPGLPFAAPSYVKMANSRNRWGLYNVQMLAVSVNIEGTTLFGVVIDFHAAEPHRYLTPEAYQLAVETFTDPTNYSADDADGQGGSAGPGAAGQAGAGAGVAALGGADEAQQAVGAADATDAIAAPAGLNGAQAFGWMVPAPVPMGVDNMPPAVGGEIMLASLAPPVLTIDADLPAGIGNDGEEGHSILSPAVTDSGIEIGTLDQVVIEAFLMDA